MRPKVSVIVPIYNVEGYLSRCIESIINQTLSDIEIILVNDGSTDNSEKIIKKYAKKDKRIVALKQENGGVASAKNLGVKNATGEFIGFVDSDDWIDNSMFEKMYNCAKRENSDVVICDFYKYFDDGKMTPIQTMPLVSVNIKKDFIMAPCCSWNKLYKRGLLKDNSFPNGLIYEDLAVTPLLVNKIDKISYINECLYYYFIRCESIMNKTKFKSNFYDILKVGNLITDKVNKDKSYKLYYFEYEYLIIDNLLRDTYFRLKEIEGSYPLLNDIVQFIKDNYPNFMKNKYIKKMGIKYQLITYLIYKKKYRLLKIISR